MYGHYNGRKWLLSRHNFNRCLEWSPGGAQHILVLLLPTVTTYLFKAMTGHGQIGSLRYVQANQDDCVTQSRWLAAFQQQSLTY